jgi:cytoskeleton protein RodZ
MMETPQSNVDEGDKTLKLVNVGATLRAAREQAGLSVADIANRVKFAPKQVEALEANDFGHLPQATFLRGFVRSYARVLQLDEAMLIGSLPEDPSKQEVARTKTADVPFPNALALRRINLMWLAGALGVALVLALFLLMPEQGKVPVEPVVETVILPAPEVAASAVAAEEQAVEPESKAEPAKVVEKAKSQEAAKEAVAQKTDANAQTAQAPLPQIAAASAPAAIPIEILRRRPMHFVFSGDTWVEVLDVNGVILLSRTNPAGTEKWIGGPNRAPYDMTITHPERVRLYYKGKEIDLSAYAGKGSAHFKVE